MKQVKQVLPLVLLGCALLASSCRRNDYRTVKIHVPEMRNQACAQIIHSALSRVQGVEWDSIEINVSERSVTVTYDSMLLSLKNIEFTVAAAGFKADSVPADEKAQKALPPECLQ